MVDEPLLELLRQLQALNYDFTAVTPATHARVLARGISGAPTLRDIFGWNRSFRSAEISCELLSLLHAANAVELNNDRLRATVRVARLGEDLFLHSSFPTDHNDSVFFGPDTYRFARFIERQLRQLPRPAWIVDMGAGSGAGGVVAARCVRHRRITLVDVNQQALTLARVNAHCARVPVDTLAAPTIPAGADLVVANPPYIMDHAKRAYRHGGALLGGAVALDWTRQALGSMVPGGTMLLYTGVAYEAGRAPLVDALQQACAQAKATIVLEELDVDVFGEELEKPAYRCVERIAALGALITTATPGS